MRLVSVLGGRGSLVTCGWLIFSGLLWLAAACLVQRGLSIEYRDYTDGYRSVCVSCGFGYVCQRGQLECELFGMDIYRKGQLEYMFLPVRIHRVYVPFEQRMKAESPDCHHPETEFTTIPRRFASAEDVPQRAMHWLYCSLLMVAAALLSWVCACVVPCYRYLRKRTSIPKAARRWWLVNAACAGVAVLCFVAAPGPLLGGTLSRYLRRAETAAQAVLNGKQLSTTRIEWLLYADVPASDWQDRMMLGYRRQSFLLALSRSDRSSDNEAASRYLYGDRVGADTVTPELLNTLYKRFVDGQFGRTGCTVRFVSPPEQPVSSEEAAGIVAIHTNRFEEVAVAWCQGSCFTKFARKRIEGIEVMLPYYHVMYANNRGLREASRERVRHFAEEQGTPRPAK